MDCICIESWSISESLTTTGSREKRWFVSPSSFTGESELFLFKESKDVYPLEFWSEIIAHEFGKLIDIKTPETYCAKYGQKYGALTRIFTKSNINELMHGGDLMLSIRPDFDRIRGRMHNIYDIGQLLDPKSELFRNFCKILIFDALIGNIDRHQDNWGIIIVTSEADLLFQIAPAFDNGNSFGREIEDSEIEKYLSKNSVTLERYINRGRPHLRWSTDGKHLEHLNHHDFLFKLCNQYPFIIEDIINLTAFSDEQVHEMLKNAYETQIEIPRFAMTQMRIDFMKTLLTTRRNMLMGLALSL